MNKIINPVLKTALLGSLLFANVLYADNRTPKNHFYELSDPEITKDIRQVINLPVKFSGYIDGNGCSISIEGNDKTQQIQLGTIGTTDIGDKVPVFIKITKCGSSIASLNVKIADMTMAKTESIGGGASQNIMRIYNNMPSDAKKVWVNLYQRDMNSPVEDATVVDFKNQSIPFEGDRVLAFYAQLQSSGASTSSFRTTGYFTVTID